MRGGDALDPAVDLEVAGGDERAHPLAQHLDAGAGHGVDARLAQRRERAVEPEPAAIGEVARRPAGGRRAGACAGVAAFTARAMSR